MPRAAPVTIATLSFNRMLRSGSRVRLAHELRVSSRAFSGIQDDDGEISAVRTGGRETNRRCYEQSAAVSPLVRRVENRVARRSVPTAGAAPPRRTTGRPPAPAKLRPLRPDGRLA